MRRIMGIDELDPRTSLVRVDDDALARHVLTFDPRNPVAPSVLLARSAPPPLHPIPWPPGSAPVPPPFEQGRQPNDPLPACDVLVVTWTVAEAEALADVLTPGHPSSTWYHYRRDWDAYVPKIRRGAPALASDRLASYAPTAIGDRRVVCVKSELHMSQDGPALPIQDLWRQMLAETGADLVVTTGTAGAIGADVELGDVIVARRVRFDCQHGFRSRPFAASAYVSSYAAPAPPLAVAMPLLAVNADRLPVQARPPTFIVDSATTADTTVVTTDFFAFDDTTNRYGLQGLGAAVEMGDAVLGLVCTELGSAAPAWVAVRNASDPQVDGSVPLEQQKRIAAGIYEKYGYWTTVCSAIGVWAVIAGVSST